MNLKSKILFCFLFIYLGFNSYSSFAQSEKSDDIFQHFEDYYRLKNTDSVISLSEKTLKKLKAIDSTDSLLYAKLYLYKYNAVHEKRKSINNLSLLNKAISYCPNSQVGDSLKSTLYNSKAFSESNLRDYMKSYKSITKSLKLLEKLQNPNKGFLMGAYLLLSNNNAYFGNFELAKQYMRLAENVYAKNKTYIDNNTWQLNGNHHRMGVILKYRKIYMLWKLSKTSNDSLSMINTMNDLEKVHNKPNFHEEEKIYYSTALNHIGDWFISHKPDSLTTEKDIQLGLKYLFKTHDLVENKNYPGTLWAIKYNIAKGFTKGNLVEKADSVMTDLFRGISKTDGRLPFFYAQKALIKAKKNQKDSALIYFDKSIQKIHQGGDSLATYYTNFKPSKSYNHTRLLLRINEELNKYYQTDSLVQKKIGKLYYLALHQFENSYLNINFNKKQNKQLRKIIKGILNAKKMGSIDNYRSQKSILNTFEILKNQLAWKKFYESRYTNVLPELDSVKQRNAALASLLSKAKITKNIPQRDSVQRLIEKHNSYKQKQFPQLELLSNFEFSIEKLQKELTSKEVILKYILLENEIAIYQISKSNFKVHLVPWTKNEEQKLKNFINNTRNRKNSTNLGIQLGELLIPNLENKTQHLIINPDGILFKLPFEVLQIKNKFATEIYNISYTSNLGFINHNGPKTSPTVEIHIYAPIYANSTQQSGVRNKPSFLKGASNEAKNISKLFSSKLFNEGSLTKSAFIKTASKGKILHLAMHAEVNEDYPELSRLLFNNNLEKEDDHLYLEELYGLSLNAELAILSACNTGAGLEKNGNLESFQRAFTFAGVPTTVASLWQVPDMATEQIMIFFYQNLKNGQTKSEALRNAKLSYKAKYANSKLSAPYFWAGFVVYGNDAPVFETSYNYYITIILALIIIATAYYFTRKKALN
ncbi:CHAT domain-containing protein [Polaribacter sp.]|uniref:CHAT domain-containing protein n=1 Tax=Polaribacter sp. TaxID=1920175 RepID=UPI003F6AC6F2